MMMPRWLPRPDLGAVRTWGIIIALGLVIVLQALLVGFALWYLVITPLFNSGDVQGNFRYWMEIFYFLSGVVLAGTAVGALIYAGGQISALQDSHKHDVHQRNTLVFLEIEKRFSSKALVESRDEISTMVNKINPSRVNNTNFRRQFASELNRLKIRSRKRYVRAMETVLFLEGLGLLISQKYMEFEDVFLLLAPALNDYDDVFRLHLLQQRRNSNVSIKKRRELDLFGQTLRLMRHARHRANPKD